MGGEDVFVDAGFPRGSVGNHPGPSTSPDSASDFRSESPDAAMSRCGADSSAALSPVRCRSVCGADPSAVPIRVRCGSVCGADPCAKCRKLCDWSDGWDTLTTSVTQRPAFRTGGTVERPERIRNLGRATRADAEPESSDPSGCGTRTGPDRADQSRPSGPSGRADRPSMPSGRTRPAHAR